ncbi:MAG TPA: toll/interleukin-1 receptor domain-containing protein [Phycisphaerae bacterium]|nr:toll/interleukin-1 receptor domain-containing protein [Phycisphaerae bacterium]
MAHISRASFPSRSFTGRMFSKGKWCRIEIDTPDSLTIALQIGTAYGLGTLLRIFDDAEGRQLCVIVDVSRLPSRNESDLAEVKAWLPKCAILVAGRVMSGAQAVPENNIFWVGATDYSKDPQRENAHAFRRRCRFDVLNVVASCLNSNPPEAFCKFSRLAGSETHTRIYDRDDFIEAIRYWEAKGYVKLLNRAGDIQISPALDDQMMADISAYSWAEADQSVSNNSAHTHKSIVAPLEYDIFVSHASEDKDSVVKPLTDELLRRGLRVWVDYKELRLGDRLRQRIDDGLSRSRFGVVIVSPRFFAKRWPQTELDGLVALELADGRKRILPIWHDIDYEGVTRYSPSLAGRLASEWSAGAMKVADAIEQAIRD